LASGMAGRRHQFIALRYAGRKRCTSRRALRRRQS
jgi:hypothetical protein